MDRLDHGVFGCFWCEIVTIGGVSIHELHLGSAWIRLDPLGSAWIRLDPRILGCARTQDTTCHMPKDAGNSRIA